MTSARSRFADLVSGKLGSSRIADTIVFSTEKHIVVPTLGSILPFWFLVIPRLHTLNYAAQPHSTRVELSLIIRKLRSLMKAAEDPLVFEHGPAQPDSVVGCGCDHAHMHVLFAETSQKNKIYKHFEAALSPLPVLPGWKQFILMLIRATPTISRGTLVLSCYSSRPN